VGVRAVAHDRRGQKKITEVCILRKAMKFDGLILGFCDSLRPAVCWSFHRQRSIYGLELGSSASN
jgi:hypothetical protein